MGTVRMTSVSQLGQCHARLAESLRRWLICEFMAQDA